ncbi:alpha/beta fold hydrolase [Sciscionella marina]|uniref:alpha/beta fold hydrolase n=1 Tax=Sciscionella marina TaxID=508770 RepID=UPI00037BFE8A|nr:alpha/beta fold hydrolase [Sciscionella marina]
MSPAPGIHTLFESPGNEATPCVLIHGVGSDLGSWNAIAGQLTLYAPVVRQDLRGHGRSHSPAGTWDIDDFAADQLEVMDHLGIKAAHVIGFSLGGLIAQRLAARHPERVRSLVTISAVAGRTPQQRAAVLDRLDRIENDGPEAVAKESVERWYSAEYLHAHPEVRDRTLARMAALDPDSYARAYRVLATTDLAAELGTITAATLAMTGELDIGSPPEMTRRIAESVRTGRHVVFPGVRHSILSEIPDLITKEILDHVRDC